MQQYPQKPVQTNILEEDNQEIDIKAYLLKIKTYYKLLIILCLLGISAGYTYYYFKPKIYKNKLMILLNVEDENSTAFTSLAQAISNYHPRLTFENDVLKMKSFKLCKRTVEALKYEIAYFESKNYKHKEIFDFKIFQVEIDRDIPQLTYEYFKVFDINEEERSFKIELATNNKLSFYNFISGASSELKIEKNFKFGGSYSFDDWVESDFFRFKLNFNLENEITDEVFYFKINDLNHEASGFSKSLDIGPTAVESAGIDIACEGYSIDKNQAFLEEHVNQFIKLSAEIKNDNLVRTLSFINTQLSYLEDSLRYMENYLVRYMLDKKFFDKNTQSNSLIQKLFDLDREKAEEQVKLEYYNNLLKTSRSQKNEIYISSPIAVGINDPVIIKIITDLSDLMITKRKLYDLKESNPGTRKLDLQIQELMSALQRNLEAIIHASEQKIKFIHQQIRSTEDELAKIPGSEMGFVNIQRRFKLTESIYNFFLYKRSEIEITINFNRAAVTFLDTGFDNVKLVGIKPAAALLGGGSIFLFLGIGGIFLKDFFTTTIQSPTELTANHYLSILAIIAKSKYTDDDGMTVLKHPRSKIAEAFRGLRSNLKYYQTDKKSQVISVTSSVPGEGKTYTSMNTALILAMGGEKVLLIGADMRKPKIFREFSRDNKTGLSTLLSKINTLDEVVQQTDVPNLDIISSGPIPPNPSELLVMSNFKGILDKLKNTYTYIIIDTPPIMAVNDAYEIIEYSDLTLYVVRQNYSQKNVIKYIIDKYNSNIIKPLALIYNGYDVDKDHSHGYSYRDSNGYTDD